MDIFTEQLIKKSANKLDYFIFLVIAVFLSIELYFSIFILGVFSIIIFAISVYLGIKLINSRFVEFEYIITNENITIDKIIAKKSRKNVVSFNLSDVYKFENYNKNLNLSEFKKVYKVSASTDVWCMCFCDNQSRKIAVLFSPNEKTLNTIKPFLKRQVAVDAFGRN